MSEPRLTLQQFAWANAALDSGRSVTLVISPTWRDQYGLPLKEEFRRVLRVGPAATKPLDTASWRIQPPPSVGRREGFIVTFPEPLDHGLLMRALGVTRDGVPVEGDIMVDNAETRWTFTPREPWRGRSEPAHARVHVREAPKMTNEPRLQRTAAFGGIRERVTSRDFSGGQVTAIFGGAEIDLRDAELAASGARLEVTAAFGGAACPPAWRPGGAPSPSRPVVMTVAPCGILVRHAMTLLGHYAP